ncbi:MAG: hypothetical protein L0H79_00405 [Intrasporangium sp.]|uniref:tetratricopeptide repeat protein n=1 Tax=Intrasporangium sp. TaxID=1925024 RepID=UPI002647047D|nr:hypothetical protein [Intrasporangium sp.]MDN5794194.1 hypothetical protein [Intrasporangium sp.]
MAADERGPRGQGHRRDDHPDRDGKDQRAGRGGRDREDARGGDHRRGAAQARKGGQGRRDRDDRRGREAGDDDHRRAAAVERERVSRGATRLSPKSPRKPEPAIREGVTGREVDRGVKNQLRTLSKENAEGVAQHLVMVAELLDTDPEAALAHAETAVRRAGRVPAAREALGLVAYRLGDWARALSEFRTVRRLSGSSHLLPLMVDCERGLGRPHKALEIAQSEETQGLSFDERVELAIVVSGIRRDIGQLDAAAANLSDLAPRISPHRGSAPRLYYAYADALLASGDKHAAREWFARAADADHELTTDAAERLDDLDGISVLDLLEGEPEDADEDIDGDDDSGDSTDE